MTYRVYFDKNGKELYAFEGDTRDAGIITYNVFTGEVEITVEADSKLKAFEKAREMYERTIGRHK